MRLGFSIRVYGDPNLPSHDARPHVGGAHLSVGLAYLRDIILYLQANHIHMYRMHSRLLPTEGTRLEEQIAACEGQLQALSELIRASDLRLSFHPYSAVVLNALDEDQFARSLATLQAHVSLLEALALGPEAVVVLHVGGVYDDPLTSRERFARRYQELPESVRRRVALEQDDHRFGLSDVRALHETCGVPLVFDSLHHDAHNPERVPRREALAFCLSTWPPGARPKVHFASPRSELRGLGQGRVKMPSWTEHADCVNPFDFLRFLEMAEGLPPFDIMLEAKARDLALLQLRQALERYAPEWAQQIH
jgi:UV DNA damage endonuclease